jgi:hypothetical protein
MHDGQDIDMRASVFVDDAIALHNYLSDASPLELWNDPP